MESVNEKKETALRTIDKFKGIPPRALLATLAGIHRSTLLDWEKEDKQFKDDLQTILENKRIEKAKELYDGYDRCVEQNHYPAIRDGLKAIDPETWGEAGETTKPPAPVYLIGIYNNENVLVQNLTDDKNGKNGKQKLEGDK